MTNLPPDDEFDPQVVIPKTYILDAEGNPVHEPDRDKWEAWMKERAGYYTLSEYLKTRRGRLTISTGFVGEPPGYSVGDTRFADKPPQLWETHVHNEKTGKTESVSSTDSQKDAAKRHRVIVDRCRKRAEKEWAEKEWAEK